MKGLIFENQTFLNLEKVLEIWFGLEGEWSGELGITKQWDYPLKCVNGKKVILIFFAPLKGQ